MKIIVSAGGTGGHIYPALGVIEKLLEDKNNDVLFIGTTNRMEAKLIPSLNINYIGIEIYGLTKNIIKDIKNIGCIISSYNKVKKIMLDYKPDAVIGFGGYVTFPVILAAHNLNIRTFLHEQNKIPGKANKFLFKYCDKTFVSFEGIENYNNKIVYSGNPCGEKAINSKSIPKESLGFSKDKKLILIVMGSLGSEQINSILSDFLLKFNSDKEEILFITGKSSYDKFKVLKVKPCIKIIDYYENLSSVMKECDLIISRAGASTISEILALNKPSILIPSPYVANNHQYYNALELKNLNVSFMLEQKDLNKDTLQSAIEYVFKYNDFFKDNLNKLPKMNGSSIIVNEIKKTIG